MASDSRGDLAKTKFAPDLSRDAMSLTAARTLTRSGRNLIQRPRMIQEAAVQSPAVLMVFDLLEAGGEDLRALPLLDRRRALREYVRPAPRLH